MHWFLSILPKSVRLSSLSIICQVLVTITPGIHKGRRNCAKLLKISQIM